MRSQSHTIVQLPSSNMTKFPRESRRRTSKHCMSQNVWHGARWQHLFRSSSPVPRQGTALDPMAAPSPNAPYHAAPPSRAIATDMTDRSAAPRSAGTKTHNWSGRIRRNNIARTAVDIGKGSSCEVYPSNHSTGCPKSFATSLSLGFKHFLFLLFSLLNQ